MNLCKTCDHISKSWLLSSPKSIIFVSKTWVINYYSSTGLPYQQNTTAKTCMEDFLRIFFVRYKIYKILSPAQRTIKTLSRRKEFGRVQPLRNCHRVFKMRKQSKGKTPDLKGLSKNGRIFVYLTNSVFALECIKSNIIKSS